MNAFLAQHPDGFYASLARIQLDKIAAEEAHAVATEKARLAEQERARLAGEGAQKAQQAKADADAKAAEQARIAAEKAKQAAVEQAAEAERKRTDKASNPTGVADSAATDRTTAGPTAAPKAQDDKATNVAALTAGPAQPDVTKSVQIELRRVGCLTGEADGQWNASSQRSLTLFNRYAGTKFDVKLASTDALDAIKLKPSRVCPPVCEHGFKADGDRCSRIVCAEGSFLNDDNECEKRRGKTPTASRAPDTRPDRSYRERPRPEVSAAKPQATGQIVCDYGGCRPVRRGCRIDYQGGSPRNGSGGNEEVCN
jgi:hypothetical protein